MFEAENGPLPGVLARAIFSDTGEDFHNVFILVLGLRNFFEPLSDLVLFCRVLLPFCCVLLRFAAFCRNLQ